MKRYPVIALLAVVTACATGQDPAAASRLMGHWLSASGNVEVEIGTCEVNNPRLCGTITRVLANQSMSRPGLTMSNHDDTGLRILSDFTPAGGDTFQGSILNRETGKVYDCVIQPHGAEEMVVRPYVLVTLFGQSQTWHRVR